jgi:tetratricopeptide (TPR) repeat protein
LIEEDGRGALDLLRQAQHGDSNLEGLPLLLFCACALRARQLAKKGMAKEGEAMHALAAEHRKAVVAQALSEKDLVCYIRYLDSAEALQVYADFLRQHESLPQAERILADSLVVHRCWNGLQAIPEDHPLRSDAERIQQALGAMDAADWERAGSQLQGLSRRSPFAPWRLFCKAMVCFGTGDDRGLQQALDLLPEDFILAYTVAQWRYVCSDGAKNKRHDVPVQVQEALGMEGDAAIELADKLCQAIWNQRLRDGERLIPQLAQAVYPEDPLQARIALLQIVGLAVPQVNLSAPPVHNMVQRLLPQQRVAGTMGQIGLLGQQVSSGMWNADPASIYLDHLSVDFPEPRSQALARGRVLEALARTGHSAGIHPYALPPQALQTLAQIIGEYPDDLEMITADLMMASLEADPENRAGYPFLLDLLRGHTANKPRIEKVLHDMVSRFPEDPQPCLELATFHYSSNAYRKAEATLAEARKRAPHDERILDLQAIGYLKSADQSRKRGRFEAAFEDLQRAADLNRPQVAAMLQVKRLLLEIVSVGSETTERVERHLDTLSPGDQLRTLTLLIHDLKANSNVKNVKAAMAAELDQILHRRASALDQLSTGQAVELLAPLPMDFAVLFDDLQVAPVLSAYWSALMARVDGEELIALFDILMDCGEREEIRAQINRRLGALKKGERDPLLLFYLAVIRHQEGTDYDSRRFKEVLAMVNAAQRTRLQAAAVRLARHTHGPLRQALQQFKFEVLDLPLPFAGGGLPPLEQLLEMIGGIEGLDPDEEMFLDGEDIVEDLNELEERITENVLRGAAVSTLRDFAGTLRTNPQTRRELERIGRQCQDEGLDNDLSRELEIILFPRKRKKRQR